MICFFNDSNNIICHINVNFINYLNDEFFFCEVKFYSRVRKNSKMSILYTKIQKMSKMSILYTNLLNIMNHKKINIIVISDLAS